MRRNFTVKGDGIKKLYIIFFLSFYAAFSHASFCFAEKITYSTTDEFLMDTPVPTPYEKVSLDFYSAITQTKNGSDTNTPALMANVGVYPDVQLYGVFQGALSAPKHLKTNYGYGDARLGIKYRFIHETESLPSVALYPKITLPSGDASKGLGNGKWIGRFPIWIQKKYGDWKVTLGGGGYINHAKNQCNYPFGGALVQYQLTDYFMLGNEFFAVGKMNSSTNARLISNFGGSYFFDPHSFLAFSAGYSIAGTKEFVAFLGYGITWSPCNK